MAEEGISVGTLLLAAMTLAIVVLMAIFIYQTFRKNRKDHYLTFGLVMGLVPLTVMTLSGVIPMPEGSLAFIVGHIVGGIGFSFLFFFIYLHYELVSRPAPHFLRFSIMSFLLGSRFVVVIFRSLFPTEQIILLLYYVAFDTMRLFSFGFACFIAWQMWKLTKELESGMEFLSTVLLVLSGFFGPFHRPLGIGYVAADTKLFFVPLSGFLVFSYFLTVVGMVVFLMVFIINPDYLYRLPVPLHHIILYNESGLTAYSRSIQSKGIETPKITDQLFSGAITAISSLLSESVKTQVHMHVIETNKMNVVIEHHPTYPVRALIIGYRLTYFVRKSLKNFLLSIPQEIMEQLSSPGMILDLDRAQPILDRSLQQSFPYVEFSKKPF